MDPLAVATARLITDRRCGPLFPLAGTPTLGVSLRPATRGSPHCYVSHCGVLTGVAWISTLRS